MLRLVRHADEQVFLRRSPFSGVQWATGLSALIGFLFFLPLNSVYSSLRITILSSDATVFLLDVNCDHPAIA